MPCQHCQLNQELTTLKQQQKSLDDTPPSQRNYTWRKNWNQNKQQILKTEQQLTETACSCEDWEATTPRNSQFFTFEVPKFDEPTEPKSSSDNITDNLLKETQETWQRERERERRI